jgi:hypothetical protein
MNADFSEGGGGEESEGGGREKGPTGEVGPGLTKE